MPLRRIDFISRGWALAEPVPFTVAILTEKSLTREGVDAGIWGASGNLGFSGLERLRLVLGVRPVHHGLLHVPRRGRTALRAQSAVHAQVLVLHHDASGLRQARGDVQVLRQVLRRRLQALAQVRLLTVVRDGEAVHRTDVQARVALDAQLRGEHRLYVAVEAALHLLLNLLGGEAELDLDVQVSEALLEGDVRG